MPFEPSQSDRYADIIWKYLTVAVTLNPLTPTRISRAPTRSNCRTVTGRPYRRLPASASEAPSLRRQSAPLLARSDVRAYAHDWVCGLASSLSVPFYENARWPGNWWAIANLQREDMALSESAPRACCDVYAREVVRCETLHWRRIDSDSVSFRWARGDRPCARGGASNDLWACPLISGALAATG